MFNPQTSPPMHRWRGVSGEWYWFSVFGIETALDLDGIVYIFTRVRADRYFDALYAGQSGQGDVRLSQHEKLPAARRLGATHLHVHFVSDRAARFAVETDLRRSLRPPLNEQPAPPATPGIGGLAGLGAPPPRNYLAAMVREPSSGIGGLGGLSAFGMGTDLDWLLASLPPAPANATPASGIGSLFGNNLNYLLRRR